MKNDDISLIVSNKIKLIMDLTLHENTNQNPC